MYIVRNNTAGKVIIGDLNLVFLHGEEKDLDLLFSRDVLNKSINLKSALNSSHHRPPAVVLLVDDETTNTVEFTAPETGVNSAALAEMEQRISNNLASQLSQLSQPQTNNSNDELNQKMDLLLKAIAQNHQSGTGVTNKPLEIEEDEDKMIKIHERAIGRLIKNSTGQIKANESEVKDSGINEKADELEGLI